MPFLRFTRDRRGYETTALVHAFREHGRAHPRILYWFRSPVAVRIGRPAIDEDAIRLIEERHRDLSFDWAKILQSRALAESGRLRAPERQPPAEPRGDQVRTPREATEPAGSETATSESSAAAPAPAGEQRRRRRRSRRRGSRPATDTDAVSDARTPAARAVGTAEARPTTAAGEVFSLEDLTRLRGRHAALLARIDREVPDADAARELREAGEGLNPDSWITRADVEQALEHYEERYRQVLDALSSLRGSGSAGPRPA